MCKGATTGVRAGGKIHDRYMGFAGRESSPERGYTPAVDPASAFHSFTKFSSRARRRQRSLSLRLLADAQLADDVPVAVRIVRLEIIEQAAALAYQHQQAATRSMVFRVGLEMFGQLANALAQDRDLHFRAAGVGVMSAKARDNVGFFCRCQHESALLLLLISVRYTS